MCRRFQKITHYTLHATAYLDQHLITISSPTVLHNHWLSLQPYGHPSPARRLSLSLCLCMHGVSFQWQSTALQYVAAVYCTHRQSVGKLPPDVPCWARSSGPQVAVVISRSSRLNASRVDRVLPLFCQSSHHVYASEDAPTCNEITEEGATNTPMRLIYEFFPNFSQKYGVQLIFRCDL